MKNKLSQVSMEFLLLIGLLIFVFFGFILLAHGLNLNYRDIDNYLTLREECLKFSNAISSVQSSGPGTELKTYSKYLVNFFNSSLIEVGSIQNVTINEKNIAVLASEAGESTQSFYDLTTQNLDPVWFKVCFSDLSGNGCQQWQPTGMLTSTWSSISYDLADLIENIDDYNVIYLEDSHIQYNSQYDGENYFDIIKRWVEEGNILILSEHIVCREQSSGSYSSTSYRCNPPGSYNNDIWDRFNKRFYQRPGSYGNDIRVINQPDPTLFPNLKINDTFDFEEDSFIEEIVYSNKTESESLSLVGGFVTTSNCICNTPSTSGQCIRHQGSTTVPANATYTSNLNNGTYNLKIRYCGENDGNDQWWIYRNGNQIDNWMTTSSQPNWKDKTINGTTVNKGDKITLSCDRGTSNSNCRTDFIEFSIVETKPKFEIIATYNDNGKAAISWWDLGSGRVFYFGDFQVEFNQTKYSQILTELIEKSSILLNQKEQRATCTFYGNVDESATFSGNIIIKNIGNKVIISNETS